MMQVACRDTLKLTKEDLYSKLRALPAWQLNEAETTLTRTFTAKNFVAGDLLVLLQHF